MNCDRYKQRITLLASGDLPENERDQVEEHFLKCASCLSGYEALRKICDQIRGLAREDDKAEVPDGLPERLEERFVTAATRSLLPASRCTSVRRRSARRLLIATAACILIGLAVWMVERARIHGDLTRRERETANVIAPTRHVAANPEDLPEVNAAAGPFVYYRAWLQSAEALDDLLTREASVVLRPEPIETALSVRKFLKTMNLFEEEQNETHSMRGGDRGALV